jgi:hypothetical protein
MAYLGPQPYPLAILPGSNIPLTALDATTQAAITGAAQKSRNLGDLTDPVAACNNIGALTKANNLSDVASKPAACTNIGAVQKVGDTMTGDLILNKSGGYAGIVLQSPNGQGPRLQANTTSPSSWGCTNVANTVWTMRLDDSGNMILSGNITTGSVDSQFYGRVIMHPGGGNASAGECYWYGPQGYYFTVRARSGGGI